MTVTRRDADPRPGREDEPGRKPRRRPACEENDAAKALAAIRTDDAAGTDAIAEGMPQAADAAAGADRADLATKADLYREIGALRSEMRWMLGFQAALILAAADFVNVGNAARVRDMIARHYVGGFRAGKATKPLVNLAARIEEVASGLLAGAPRRIGEKVVRSL